MVLNLNQLCLNQPLTFQPKFWLQGLQKVDGPELLSILTEDVPIILVLLATSIIFILVLVVEVYLLFF
jgi:hypothetical protein